MRGLRLLESVITIFLIASMFGIFNSVNGSNEVDLGIYTGPGAYQDGVNYLTTFAIEKGFSYKLLYEEDIVSGKLSKVKVLIIPGGWAGEVDEFGRKGYGSMSDEAVEKIRDFVKNGGGYYGICAGAYFASKYVVWEGKLYKKRLSLFNGVSIGPIDEIAPWPKTNWTDVEIEQNLGIDIWETKSFYWGGPYFYSNETNFTVLERYKVNGKPATILIKYGRGKVILTGLHHEWINYQNSELQEENWLILENILKILLEKKDSLDKYLPLIILAIPILLATTIIIYIKRKKQKQ